MTEEHAAARMTEAIRLAQKRCPGAAQIETVRPVTMRRFFAVERLDAYTLAYDPAAIAKLGKSELINEIVEALTFAPTGDDEFISRGCESCAKRLADQQQLDVTGQLGILVETMISDLRLGISRDTPDGYAKRLKAIMESRR